MVVYIQKSEASEQCFPTRVRGPKMSPRSVRMSPQQARNSLRAANVFAKPNYQPSYKLR